MIKLTVSMVTGHSYQVIFGAGQDQVAAEFVARKRNQVNIAHVGETAEIDPEATPIPDSWTKTLTALYPVCDDDTDGDHYDDDVDYNAIANEYEAQYGW